MTDGNNDRMIAKVQALLAKAESTTFDEERDALVAKAQELMTRHAIDEAMAAAGPRHRGGSRPTMRSFMIADPYRSAKRSLLAAIAGANDVWVITGAGQSISLVGFISDIEVVEVLFGSLLVQATREMHLAAAGDAGGRLRAFRHAFFVAYGSGVGHRLRAARLAATADAQVTHGAALVPVMAKRRDDVDAFLNETFPSLSTRRTTLSSGAGWKSGRAAADRADLGTARLDRGRAS